MNFIHVSDISTNFGAIGVGPIVRNVINVMSALGHTFNHMFNQMVGPIPTKIEFEDMPLEEMGLILNSPYYLSWGSMIEFHKCIT